MSVAPAEAYLHRDVYRVVGHPMFKSTLKISLISIALALAALPLSAATFIALTLIDF
jgi:hypothetical protein